MAKRPLFGDISGHDVPFHLVIIDAVIINIDAFFPLAGYGDAVAVENNDGGVTQRIFEGSAEGGGVYHFILIDFDFPFG